MRQPKEQGSLGTTKSRTETAGSVAGTERQSREKMRIASFPGRGLCKASTWQGFPRVGRASCSSSLPMLGQNGDQTPQKSKEARFILAHSFRGFSVWQAGSQAEMAGWKSVTDESCSCPGTQVAGKQGKGWGSVHPPRVRPQNLLQPAPASYNTLSLPMIQSRSKHLRPWGTF